MTTPLVPFGDNASLISVEELQNRLQTTLDADVAEQACILASATITGYCDQDLVYKSHVHTLPVANGVLTGITVPDTHPLATFPDIVGVVRLPQRPVVAVTTVVVDEVTLPTNEWYWDVTRQELLLEDHDAYAAVVTYTAGFAAVPNDIKAVALALATAEVTNPRNVAQERLADYSVTYRNQSDDLGLTQRQQAILNRYRGNAGTIRPAIS